MLEGDERRVRRLTRIWVDRPLLERRRNVGARPILASDGGEIRRGRRVRILGPSEVVFDDKFAPALVRIETYADVEVE